MDINGRQLSYPNVKNFDIKKINSQSSFKIKLGSSPVSYREVRFEIGTDGSISKNQIDLQKYKKNVVPRTESINTSCKKQLLKVIGGQRIQRSQSIQKIQRRYEGSRERLVGVEEQQKNRMMAKYRNDRRVISTTGENESSSMIQKQYYSLYGGGGEGNLYETKQSYRRRKLVPLQLNVKKIN